MSRKKTTDAPAAIMAIKGFDADLKCRGFQFEPGKTYTHDGPVKACEAGFHAVTGHPLAVFKYYKATGSRFFRVKLSGETHSDDGEKTAAQILKVGDELGLRDLTLEAVKWVMDRAKPEGEVAKGKNGLATASGYYGAATASGNSGAATASGYSGAATASGYSGAATASGYYGAATASGYSGKVQGKDGNALFAVERSKKHDGRGYPILSVACGIVGQDGIKADTWYVAKGGKLVEAGQ